MAGGLRPQAYVHNPMEWVDPLGLTGCPTVEAPQTKKINSAEDAPNGEGIYQFRDSENNVYSGSTNDFNSRMADHIRDGRLKPGQNVEFTQINTPGRTDNGARRVRRFFEQDKIGLDTNGVPLANKTSGWRAVSAEKWKNYTDSNGKINFTNPYFN